MQRFGERADEKGLGETGDAHEKAVPPGQQAEHELLDDIILPDDDFVELASELIEGGSQRVDGIDIIGGQGVGGISHRSLDLRLLAALVHAERRNR